MEDERQLVRDLAKRPYSKQALHDVLDAFNDLSGRDKRALVAEAMSNLNITSEDLAKAGYAFARLGAGLERLARTLARIDLEQVIYHYALRLAPLLARERKAAIFDAAVIDEAKKLNITPAISSKFAETVGPGLEKQGFKAGRVKILNSVRRSKSMRNRRNSTGS